MHSSQFSMNLIRNITGRTADAVVGFLWLLVLGLTLPLMAVPILFEKLIQVLKNMKQFFNKLLAIDKLAHIGWGALICSFFTIVTLLQEVDGPIEWHDILYCIIGTVAVVILMLIKEYVIDEQADNLDLVASLMGCIPVWLAVAIGIVFNLIIQTRIGW